MSENNTSPLNEENEGNLIHDSIKPQNICDEMETSYLDYAMSVIISRALPDVRDGLKPVHRRILYAMHELGLRSTSKFRKSAAVVGEVMGKYHPHGDSAIYDSMVRMAQDFSLRYMLVNGQGNFGSIDGDNAAAMRYTEAKFQKITETMLEDIDKDTVDFAPNYDASQYEPKVLPSKLPQLLLNGATGIAVGMATNIPPHNLREVIDAVIMLIDNPESTFDDITTVLTGPDFPTAGMIYNKEAIKEAYATGRGGIVIRAKAEIEETKNNRHAIIVTEIPYQVNKSNLIEKIATLVRDKKITSISDLRDESNREGIRMVIELKKGSFPNKTLNQLYKYTQLQTTFNLNMIAIVNGIQPKLLNVKEMLNYFIKHREEVIVRRTQYELNVAKERAHILEGLKVAIDNIDEVISTIRASKTKEEAHGNLIKKFKLSDRQSKAILELRLQTLAGLERQKINDEYDEKLKLIDYLESILASNMKVREMIKEDLAFLKEKYGDERRTKVIPHALGKFSLKDTIPNEPVIVMLSSGNYVKRVPEDTFKVQNRGGKGIIGSKINPEDEIKLLQSGMSHDDILLFTNTGRVFRIPIFELPQGTRTDKGKAIINILPLKTDEKITAMQIIPNGKLTGDNLIMGTRKGTIKKTSINEFKEIRQSGLIAIKIREGDSLEWVKQVTDEQEVFMVTTNGQCIRFNESDVRPMGRPSMGVKGINLKNDDMVIDMGIIKSPDSDRLLTVVENGLAKCTKIKEYRIIKRGGSGVKTAQLTKKTGRIVGARIVTDADNDSNIIIMSKKGQIIRMQLKDIPNRGRSTKGVFVMRMKKDGDTVSSISLISTS